MTFATIAADWDSWLPQLLPGLLVSLKLTGALLAFGLPLGVVLAVLAESPSRLLRWSVACVVELGRGTPTLVLIYLVYFGLPHAGLTLSAFLSVTLAIGLNAAAYSSEIFRAGLRSVGRGQRDAAKAIGLMPSGALRFVVLPQALRAVVPPVLGYAIIYFQSTSLAYVVAVPELLTRAYQVGSLTFKFFSVLALAGVLYALVAVPASRMVVRMEHRQLDGGGGGTGSRTGAGRRLSRMWRRIETGP